MTSLAEAPIVRRAKGAIHRRMVSVRAFVPPVRFATLVAVGAALLSFLVPNRYTATASFTVDTPSGTQSLSQLAGLTAQLGLTLPSSSSAASPYLFVDLSVSDTVLDYIVQSAIPDSVFRRTSPAASLTVHYGLHDPRPERLFLRTVEKLRKRVDVRVNARSAVISVAVWDYDPGAAAWLASAILDQMQHYVLVARSSRAKAEREFLEGRTLAAQAALGAAEETLATFLSENRAATQSPLLQIREAQLRRRVDIAQTLYAALARDLERARSEEVRDTPAITVMTAARPPLRKSAPHRLLLVIIAAVAALLLHATRPQWEEALRRTVDVLSR